MKKYLTELSLLRKMIYEDYFCKLLKDFWNFFTPAGRAVLVIPVVVYLVVSTLMFVCIMPIIALMETHGAVITGGVKIVFMAVWRVFVRIEDVK